MMRHNYEDYNHLEEFDEEYKYDLKQLAYQMKNLQNERNKLNRLWLEADEALKDPKKSPKKYVHRKEKYEARYNEIASEYESIFKAYTKLTKEWKIAKIGAVEHFKMLQEEHDKKVAKLTKERLLWEFEHTHKCSYQAYKELVEKYGREEADEMVKSIE